VKTTGGWYTVETHNTLVSEIGVDEPIYSTVQVLAARDRKMHVFYRLHARADDRLLATSEAMYLHVGRESGRVCPAGETLVANAKAIAEAHAGLSAPDAVGRYVGQRD